MLLAKSISKNSLILGTFAFITAGTLAGTFLLTDDRIAASERRAAQRALFEIIPPSRFDNDLLASTWSIPDEDLSALGLQESNDIHIAKKDDNTVAVIIPCLAPDGYSGDIKLLVGVNVDGTVAGVRVLAHRETPGLGDKISLAKSDWVLSFDGRSLENPEPERWDVKKNGGVFDQFTGATITPRAVISRVEQTLHYFRANKDRILSVSNEPAL